jgi:hypothetical protein
MARSLINSFYRLNPSLSALRREDVQIRQGRWAIVDLVGKGNRPDCTHANLGEGSRGQVAERCISYDGLRVQGQSAVTELSGVKLYPKTSSGT